VLCCDATNSFTREREVAMKTRSQLTLAGAGFEKYTKTTRRAQFLAEMDRVVPWRELCVPIEPVYPKPGNGRPPVGLERLLRMLCLPLIRPIGLTPPAAGIRDAVHQRAAPSPPCLRSAAAHS